MRELLDRSLRGDVHVEFDFPESLWPVEVDPGELELVILNLAVNARDAMPNGGTIVVRGENLSGLSDDQLSGDFVRLSVVDTGIGMDQQILSRVFEPFFTTKDIGKGSGLGLAQVYGFAAQSRGTVRIKSQIGQGTSIELYLPKSQNRPTQTHHLIDLSKVRPKTNHHGRILLVEDDEEVAALVSEMLDELGYDVTHAASGAAALGALADGRVIDLIFSDIMMPGGMNGVELAREIRKRRSNIPIFLTSGYTRKAPSTRPKRPGFEFCRSLIKSLSWRQRLMLQNRLSTRISNPKALVSEYLFLAIQKDVVRNTACARRNRRFILACHCNSAVLKTVHGRLFQQTSVCA